MGPIPGRGTWQGFATDVLALCLFLALVILLDACWAAFKRRRSGGEFLRWSDIRERLSAAIYLPFILGIAAWEHLFGAYGFGLFDDEPYFLGVLGLLAVGCWLLVRWARRQP